MRLRVERGGQRQHWMRSGASSWPRSRRACQVTPEVGSARDLETRGQFCDPRLAVEAVVPGCDGASSGGTGASRRSTTKKVYHRAWCGDLARSPFDRVWPCSRASLRLSRSAQRDRSGGEIGFPLCRVSTGALIGVRGHFRHLFATSDVRSLISVRLERSSSHWPSQAWESCMTNLRCGRPLVAATWGRRWRRKLDPVALNRIGPPLRFRGRRS